MSERYYAVGHYIVDRTSPMTDARLSAAAIAAKLNAHSALLEACKAFVEFVKAQYGREDHIAIAPGMHVFEPFHKAVAAIAQAEPEVTNG